MAKPTLLLLGTNHFDNPDNGDMFMTHTSDLLSYQRQEEIINVVEAVKMFHPTKIALEVLTENQDSLNNDFHSYLAGDFKLTANERHQIGFRLGKEMGLEELHAVDWNQAVEGVPDMEEWATKNNSEVFSETVEEIEKVMKKSQEYFNTHSIGEYLLHLNKQEAILENHRFYMQLALVGSEKEPGGAMWAAQYWYYRNMLIYKNLMELADSSDDRIFVLYGAGHLHVLQQFIKDSGKVNLESVEDYLG
ncbi:DUF5694 domain-containing protein [Virgibacillus kekensis]|uniref:DUF5694 domain-containing protein n=1 Tax=Virgibacillus kekensis TaxID=202261 RepID=A0ABV9DLM4_9BACI